MPVMKQGTISNESVTPIKKTRVFDSFDDQKGLKPSANNMIVETGDTEEEASETQHSSLYARGTQLKKRQQLSLKDNLIRVRNVRTGRRNLLSSFHTISVFNKTTKGLSQGKLFSPHTSNDYSMMNKNLNLDSGHQTIEHFETGGSSVDVPKATTAGLAFEQIPSIKIEEEYKIDHENLSFTPRQKGVPKLNFVQSSF